MDVSITNLGTVAPDDNVFVPGPNLDIPATETKVWPNVTVADIDNTLVLRQLVLDGKVSISVSEDTTDGAQALTGSIQPYGLPKRTVALLPTGYVGRMAFATNGRTGAEGVGAGTGVPVVFANGQWRRLEDMAIVAA